MGCSISNENLKYLDTTMKGIDFKNYSKEFGEFLNFLLKSF